MGQVNLPNNSDANTPSSGKTAVFTNSSGNLATKDAEGNVREYSPTPLESEGMVYGVRWDSVNDTMQPGIVDDGSFVATDYSNFPIQEQMKRGLLTNSGEWAELNERDSSRLPDGTSATLDGSSGQIMVQIPRFYQVITRSGDYVYFLVSEQPFSFDGVSAWVPLGFRDKSYRYCGAFEAVAASDATDALAKSIVKDTSGYSMSYPNPFTDRTRGQFRTQCDDGVFHQFDWGLYEILLILFLTEFKTWNSQDVLPGYTERDSFDYSYTSKAGQTLSLGNYSGSIWDDDLGLYIANSFRGVENIFGNIWKWTDGINIDNPTGDPINVYVCFDPANFADDTTTNYIDTGLSLGFEDNNDYIKDIQGETKYAPFYPIEIGNGADSGSFITDYHWNSAGGWRGLGVGGHLSNSARAGLASLGASNASSNSFSSRGARPAA